MKIICLMGPTASGKTDISLKLAQDLNGEIVSVDSAMVYQGLDIGTAKPSLQIRGEIPHYLIDILSPEYPYSAAKFQIDALNAIEVIQHKGKIPILVGGTMLYFKALQQGLSILPPADEQVREKLSNEAAVKSWQEMHARLAIVDPESAERINPNDPQRIQRALEVFEITQKPLSYWWQAKQESMPSLEFINIALAPRDRTFLHERIVSRFHTMLANGFVKEVESLFQNANLHHQLPAIRSVGYRQVWHYLESVFTYDEMIEKGVIATRQLAKRQMTWLRSWGELTWFDTMDKNCYFDLRDFVQTALNTL